MILIALVIIIVCVAAIVSNTNSTTKAIKALHEETTGRSAPTANCPTTTTRG